MIDLRKNSVWILVAAAVGEFATNISEYLVGQVGDAPVAYVTVSTLLVGIYVAIRSTLLFLSERFSWPEKKGVLHRIFSITLSVLACVGCLAGCQTTVERNADGDVTITTSMDEEQAAAFADRMLQEAIQGYTLYQEQETAEAERRRRQFREDIHYWAEVIQELAGE